MFKTGLLISTAMTAVVLLLSPALHAASVQTVRSSAPLDPNARFLCTYGQFYVSKNSSSTSSWWTHVAVPITGRGQTVRQIRVVEAQANSASYSHHSFTAGIYSNSPSGFPGKPIAVGTGVAGSRSCTAVTIPIAATTLKAKTTYWIEETALRNHCPALLQGDADHRRRGHTPSFCSSSESGPAAVYWISDRKSKRKGYVQTHRWWWNSSTNSSTSTTSPWKELKRRGPYFKLK